MNDFRYHRRYDSRSTPAAGAGQVGSGRSGNQLQYSGGYEINTSTTICRERLKLLREGCVR